MKGLIGALAANIRVRHAAIAVAIAALAAALTLLRPLDVVVWSLQTKLFTHQPSGEIVLVINEDETLTDPARANRLLNDALDQLDRAGAGRIVIDTPLRESADVVLDRKLRDRIAAMRDKVVLAAPVDQDNFDTSLRAPNGALFNGAAPLASSDLLTDFLDFVWAVEPAYSDGGVRHKALWTILSRAGPGADTIYPDYSIKPDDILRVDIDNVIQGDPATLASVSSRTFVISGLGGDRRVMSMPQPQYQHLPPAIIHIIAAETHMRGAGWFISAVVTLTLFGGSLLLLAGLPLRAISRRCGYAIWTSLFVIAFVATAWLGHRAMLIDPMMIGLIYAGQRIVANYRRRHLYIDAQSRLPNFTAYRRDLEAVGHQTGLVLVVAKIARLDAIFATLKVSEQGEYVRQVASRLRLGDDRTLVYHDGGKYLAMAFRKADFVDLEGHLEGLRAIVSQAVTIGGEPIDVAITIGVDQSFAAPAANRISSAIAAADQAREAYRPVFVISDFETDSEEWDHSLQARLESALSENRISVKLQPKVEMRSGRIVGAEALARWTDQQHGEIPPNRFILQCERAGRLDELTRRVMKNSMDASRHLASLNLPAKVSVNVSAIQFVDSRIVDLVGLAIEETHVDPRDMMIEITETARIENILQARDIVEAIKAMGLGFSIDDFGVGSGNLAALYELPFDELKIDRMFANEVGRSTRARAVVEALLTLSRDLGIRSVAEGIDHLATFEMLRDMGGDLAQGFCIARPQTLPLLEETLKLQQATGYREMG